MSIMVIRRINNSVPKGIIDVHLQAFQGFFLSSLGRRFLTLYYTTLMKSPKGILICMFNEAQKVVGFAAGTSISKNFHKEILFNKPFAYAWILLPKVIFNPAIIFRLIKNMSKNSSEERDDGNYAELLSIAVSPRYASDGAGKKLLNAFEDQVLENHCEQIALTTDKKNNEKVLSFYQKNGYEVFYEFEAYPSRAMYKMIKSL